MAATWTDLLDPTKEEIFAHAPCELADPAVELLLAKPQHEDEPRPTLQAHGDYVFGVMLVACVISKQDIDVVATHDALLTVRKTPPGGEGRKPYDPERARAAVRETDSAGMIAYRLVDDVAERYLDLVDDIDAEIDELEDKVETQSAGLTRARISDLRHDLLHVRRTLAPTRDVVRRIIDDVVEVQTGPEVFDHDAEVAFNAAYDKLMRALDGLDLARDLLAGVRGCTGTGATATSGA